MANGQYRTAKALVEVALADVNRGAERGRSPILLAASLARMDMVQLLLSHGANPDVGDAETGSTALMAAVRLGSQLVVDQLLAHGARVDHGDKEGRTALHVATEFRHLEVAKKLLSYGANPNLHDKVRSRTDGIRSSLPPAASARTADSAARKRGLRLTFVVLYLLAAQHGQSARELAAATGQEELLRSFADYERLAHERPSSVRVPAAAATTED